MSETITIQIDVAELCKSIAIDDHDSITYRDDNREIEIVPHTRSVEDIIQKLNADQELQDAVNGTLVIE